MRAPLAVCLACAHVHLGPQAELVSCPHCGSEVDPEFAERALSIARQIARFGYQYPRRYREDEARGVNKRYYLTPLPEVFEFLVLAALSGILGNLGFEGFKRITGILVRTYRSLPGPQAKGLDDITSTDDALRAFYDGIQEYLEAEPGASGEAARRVLEERLVDAISPLVASAALAPGQTGAADARVDDLIARITVDLKAAVAEALAPPPRLSADELSQLWARIDLAG